MCTRPHPHYTVFKRKRYCFFPFSKRFASTFIVSVSFSPVHTTTPIRIENALKPYILSFSRSLHSSSITSLATNLKSCPATLKSILVLSLIIQVLTGFDRVVFIIIVPPKVGKLRSFITSCSLLEKLKSSLNTVKSVKRLKITAINKEATRKRLSAVLDTHGSVVCSQGGVVSFSPSTLGKQHFQTVPFSNRSTLESVLETIRFRWSFSAL